MISTRESVKAAAAYLAANLYLRKKTPKHIKNAELDLELILHDGVGYYLETYPELIEFIRISEWKAKKLYLEKE